MVTIVRRLYQLLTPHERRRATIVFLMILCMGFLDMIGVASIVPFMSVLARPTLVFDNPNLHQVYGWSGIQDPKNFLFLLGLVVLVLLIGSIGFKAITTYAIVRFASMREFSLSARLVSKYLNQPYEWFLNRHSADLGKAILTDVAQVVGNAILPLGNVIAAATSIVFIVFLLMIADPILALSVFGILVSAYAAIYLALNRLITESGKQRWENNGLRFQVVSEAFGGIKEMKLAGLEGTFCSRYKIPAERNARAMAVSTLAGQLPKFALEALAFGGMLGLALFLMRTQNALENALPVLALYALAGYKMLPMLQQVYHGMTSLKFAGPTVEKLFQDFQSPGSIADSGPQRHEEALTLQNSLCLENISYRYPNSEKDVIRELTLNIPALSTVGLVGATGSGKTTTVDIILGLLQPSSGLILVDGQPVTSVNMRSWQKCLGYVPQHIYLSDDTIAANIAFGIEKSNIDMAAVRRAAEIANLHEFVCSGLPLGYETLIGERGVRLSGGQRQRIGIARAMYHSPGVVILDEATSALDNVTEQAVMEAVTNLSSRVTLILIAHRLTTVKNCDKVFLLERGRLAAWGTYDELISENESFRNLALAGTDK